MAEVFFYHLQNQPLDAVLPRLLGLSLERGWRALVKLGSAERVAVLDDHLWTFSDESFLPHGTDAEPDPADHPVLLTAGDANANAAQALFLGDGARPPADLSAFQRVAIMLDGTDAAAVEAGRALWREVRGAGHVVSYWQQAEDGRWAKKA